MKDLMLFGLIVTGCASAQASSDQEQQALQNASIAFYKQSGLEAAIQYKIDQDVSEDTKQIVGNVFLVAKIIKERRIEYGFTF